MVFNFFYNCAMPVRSDQYNIQAATLLSYQFVISPRELDRLKIASIEMMMWPNPTHLASASLIYWKVWVKSCSYSSLWKYVLMLFITGFLGSIQGKFSWLIIVEVFFWIHAVSQHWRWILGLFVIHWAIQVPEQISIMTVFKHLLLDLENLSGFTDL